MKSKRKVSTRLYLDCFILEDDKHPVKVLCQIPRMRLIISIDSSDPEIYECIRQGGSFQRLAYNLSRLSIIRHEVGSSIVVECHCLVNQLNLHQLRAIVDFVASQKFHILTFIPLHDYPALEVLDELALPAMEDASYYACDKGLLCNHYSRRIDKPQSTPSTVTSKIWRCPRPWQHVYVLCNGDIAPCCYLLNSLETIMGNVMCESLDQIWNSQKYQTLRHSALQGYPDFCCSEKGCRAKVSFTPNVTND